MAFKDESSKSQELETIQRTVLEEFDTAVDVLFTEACSALV